MPPRKWPLVKMTIRSIEDWASFCQIRAADDPHLLVCDEKAFTSIDNRRAFEQNEMRAFITEFCLKEPVNYLEFGVYNGQSIEMALKTLGHPESKFFGFDTFDGIPEGWPIYDFDRRSQQVTDTLVKIFKAGSWDAEGCTPAEKGLINDHRVTFLKGLFQDTLIGFINENKELIANRQNFIWFDCDIYTSYLFLLTSLHNIFKSKDVVYFDEFHPAHRSGFEAFRQYVNSYYCLDRFQCVVYPTSLECCAFQIR